MKSIVFVVRLVSVKDNFLKNHYRHTIQSLQINKLHLETYLKSYCH